MTYNVFGGALNFTQAITVTTYLTSIILTQLSSKYLEKITAGTSKSLYSRFSLILVMVRINLFNDSDAANSVVVEFSGHDDVRVRDTFADTFKCQVPAERWKNHTGIG